MKKRHESINSTCVIDIVKSLLGTNYFSLPRLAET